MAATRILPIVWPTLTLYCSLDVTSRKTATEFCPRGSYATPVSLRSASNGLRSDVVNNDTNGSRRPDPSYANTSRLIRAFGAVSAAGFAAAAVAAFNGLSGDGGVASAFEFAAGFDVFVGVAGVAGCGAGRATTGFATLAPVRDNCACACADAALARPATRINPMDTCFIIVSPLMPVHKALCGRRMSAPGTRCRRAIHPSLAWLSSGSSHEA